MIYENPELRVNFSYYHAWRINASVKHKKDTNQAFMMHNHCMNHVAEHVKCFEKNWSFTHTHMRIKLCFRGFCVPIFYYFCSINEAFKSFL